MDWLENSGFRKALWDLLLRFIRQTRPATLKKNNETREKAWGNLLSYMHLKAEKDAKGLIDEDLLDHDHQSNMAQSGLNDLINEAQNEDTLYGDAIIQVVHDHAVIYAFNEVAKDYKSDADGMNKQADSFMRKYYEQFKDHLEIIKLPRLDNRQVLYLTFWLMEYPWYRIFLTVRFHCPDTRCNEDCWQKGEKKKKKTRKQKRCDRRRGKILNEVHSFFFKRSLSPGGRNTLTKRARDAFNDCCEWLQSPSCKKIPSIIIKNLPGTYEDEICSELEKFYAALYGFRLYKDTGQGI